MRDNNTSSSSSGIGLAGVMFVVLFVLKITEQIDWSWWWITLPLWLGFGIIFGAVAIAFIVWLIARFAVWLGRKKQ